MVKATAASATVRIFLEFASIAISCLDFGGV